MPDPMKHQTTFYFWLWDDEDGEYTHAEDFMTFKDDIVHFPGADFVENLTGAH
jgi:hypothetical protein